MTVETTMSLTSIGDLEGSGTLKITFSGDVASELRQRILSEFDADFNQLMDGDEARDALISLSDALSGRAYWGVTMTVANDFPNVTDAEVSNLATGLVYTDWNSTEDLSFSMDLGCSGQGISKVILITDCAVDAFVDAFNDTVDYAFRGSMHLSHSVMAFGVGSFTYPEVTNGSFQEVRTPAGVLLWYESDFEVGGTGALTRETITYENFTVMENQQIAFVILIIGTLMIARMPRRRFENFKKLHPKRYRKYARPKMSVKISAIALLAAVWLLYLLPYLFSFVLDGFLVYSYYFMFLVPAAIIAEYGFSRYIYDKSALDIPEEAIIEVKQAFIELEEEDETLCSLCHKPIDVVEELHRCEECGTEMHIECADRAQACPACAGILFPQDTRSIECKVCGESFLHSGKDDPYSIQCTRCGAFQEEVEASKNYIVIDHDPMMAYRMIRAMGISGRPAMVMTSEFPGKTRADNELGDEVDVRWLSDSTTDIDNVNPKDLEGDAMETASTFLMTTKRAGLMVDGLDLLMELNGFEKIVAFIRRLNDLAMIHGSSILLFLDKSSIDDDQLRQISDEFDEVHDYL
ncbi:MAG: DUF835 domain-containing protein [Candidatus Thermoplasmatota archaeon]|nr:DUF835 domain-containing protein [Candidatus Thermoplasmatota archaeon]